jgi:hypothetical protein
MNDNSYSNLESGKEESERYSSMRLTNFKLKEAWWRCVFKYVKGARPHRVMRTVFSQAGASGRTSRLIAFSIRHRPLEIYSYQVSHSHRIHIESISLKVQNRDYDPGKIVLA